MDRGTNDTFKTELLKQQNTPCFLVSIALPTPVYATDAWVTVTFGGNSYLPSGQFLDVTNIVETAKLEVNTVNLTFSGIDQTWIQIALQASSYGKMVKIYKAFLDYNLLLLTSPLLVFQGTTDTFQISDDPGNKCTVNVGVISQFGDFDRLNGRTCNDKQQNLLFPGDSFFSFVSQLNVPMTWGLHMNARSRPQPAYSSWGGGGVIGVDN